MLATVWQILNIMRNDRKRKISVLAETCLEKSVKPQQVNIFLADFSYLKPLQRATHSTLAVDEKCCRAGGTSPKLVEMIVCTWLNMPATISIVVNAQTYRPKNYCGDVSPVSNLFRRPWARSPSFRMIINAALCSYKSTQCHVISLFSIEKKYNPSYYW